MRAGAGGADTLDGDEFRPRQLRQAEEAFVVGEQGGGVFEVVAAQDDRQQFDGAECAGAEVLQAADGLLGGRQFADHCHARRFGFGRLGFWRWSWRGFAYGWQHVYAVEAELIVIHVQINSFSGVVSRM